MIRINRPSRYEELLELARKMLNFCQENDLNTAETTEQLLEMLNQRNTIIDQIDEMNASAAQTLDPQVKSLVKEILEVDESSRNIIESSKFKMETELQKIKDGKRSNKAYQPRAIQTEGYFVDQKK